MWINPEQMAAYRSRSLPFASSNIWAPNMYSHLAPGIWMRSRISSLRSERPSPNIWTADGILRNLSARIFFLADRSEVKRLGNMRTAYEVHIMNWRSERTIWIAKSISHDEDAPSVCQFLISMKTFRNWCMPPVWDSNFGSSLIFFTVFPVVWSLTQVIIPTTWTPFEFLKIWISISRMFAACFGCDLVRLLVRFNTVTVDPVEHEHLFSIRITQIGIPGIAILQVPGLRSFRRHCFQKTKT